MRSAVCGENNREKAAERAENLDGVSAGPIDLLASHVRATFELAEHCRPGLNVAASLRASSNTFNSLRGLLELG
jgi:hypothetical protein